jgi:MFS family permease
VAAKPFESRIQDLVYNVDVGIGLKIIKVGLYILLILGLMLIYTVTQFKGLKEAEAMDYAQLGRNLAQHGKLVTQCVRPASMWYLIENSKTGNPRIDQHPDILHPPVYPALLAAGFKLINYNFEAHENTRVYPAEQWVIIPISHLATLLTGLLIFLIGLRLFDHRTAVLSLALFYLSNSAWQDSISGLNISLTTFFGVLAFYFALLSAGRPAHTPDETPAPPSLKQRLIFFLLTALVCIISFLTRYGAIILVPTLGLYFAIAYGRRGWVWSVALIIIFFVGVSPWFIRNIGVCGSPLGLAPYTALIESSAFPGDTMERTLAPTVTLSQVIPALKTKWLTQFVEIYSNPLRTLGDGILICLFVSTFFYRFVRPQVRLLRWALLLGIALTIILAAFFGGTTVRILHLFWPFAILYGVVFFFMLLDRLNFELRIVNYAVILMLCLLCSAPLIFAILPPRTGIPYPPYFPRFIRHVCNMLTPDELICTDMPWATAWYGRRNSLLLPYDLSEFYEINDYTKRISGLYLTTITRDKRYVSDLLTGSYKSWFPIFEGRIPGDFPLSQGFPIGNMNQLFLTDRRRWEE